MEDTFTWPSSSYTFPPWSLQTPYHQSSNYLYSPRRQSFILTFFPTCHFFFSHSFILTLRFILLSPAIQFFCIFFSSHSYSFKISGYLFSPCSTEPQHPSTSHSVFISFCHLFFSQSSPADSSLPPSDFHSPLLPPSSRPMSSLVTHIRSFFSQPTTFNLSPFHPPTYLHITTSFYLRTSLISSSNLTFFPPPTNRLQPIPFPGHVGRKVRLKAEPATKGSSRQAWAGGKLHRLGENATSQGMERVRKALSSMTGWEGTQDKDGGILHH